MLWGKIKIPIWIIVVIIKVIGSGKGEKREIYLAKYSLYGPLCSAT